MKKFRNIFIVLLLVNASLLKAQAPQGFKYQTSVRDNSGNLLANKLIAIKLSLIKDSAYGTTVYSEKFNVSTNDFGIANLNVGSGNVLQGTFTSINWNSGSFFLKIDIDMNNGTNFQYMGTSQLLSVPFAMYATKSGSSVDDGDKDPTNELQTLSVTGNKLNLSQANQVNIDADTTNELQQLTLTNNTLQLNKNGGNIDLTKFAVDSQQLSLNGNTLSISKGNNVRLNDIDSTNELQLLTLVNDTLKLSKNGGNVNLLKYAADSQSLVLSGRTLSISRGNSIVLTGAIDLDADPTNEIQQISIHADTLKLSRDTSFIILPKDNDHDSINEIQVLSLRSDTLNLSKNGGTAILVTPKTVQNGNLIYASASGTNSIALTLSPIPTSYTPGMIVNFKTVATNTGAVTVNLNGLGVKPLLKNVTDTLIGGDMVANQMASIIYDGTNFQFLVAPFARTANNANKIKNDTSGGLVPRGSMIISNQKDAFVGYTLSETLKTAASLENLVSATYSGGFSLYNNKVYYANNYFDIDSNIYKTKPTTSFTRTSSAQLGNDLIIVPSTKYNTSASALSSYNLSSNSLGTLNGTIPTISLSTSTLLYCNIYKIDSNFIITCFYQGTSASGMYFFKYDPQLDTVTAISGSIGNSGSVSYVGAVMNNQLYILGYDGSFSKCSFSGVTTLTNCPSGYFTELYSTTNYVVSSNNIYNPTTNTWTTRGSSNNYNFLGVCGDFAYYNNQGSGSPNYVNVYERDLSLNGAGILKIIYQETGSSVQWIQQAYTAYNKEKLIITNGSYLSTIYPSKTKYLFIKN